MKRSIRFHATVLLLLCAGIAQAGVKEGLAAYRKGDYTTAFSEYRKAAEAGDRYAYGFVGTLYLYGRGTAVDYIRAYAWLDLAVAHGDENAEGFLQAASRAMNAEQQKQADKLAEMLLKDHPVKPRVVKPQEKGKP